MHDAANFYHLIVAVMYSCSTRHHQSLKEAQSEREAIHLGGHGVVLALRRRGVGCLPHDNTETMAYQPAARSSTGLVTCRNIAGHRNPHHLYFGVVSTVEQILTLWMRATDTVLTIFTCEKSAYRARSGCRLRLRRYR